MTVVCNRTDCSFCSKNGLCTKDILIIRQQGLCSEWYNRDGIPYAQQMSTWLDKEFEQYNNRDTKDVSNIETTVQENEKKEEEVIGN